MTMNPLLSVKSLAKTDLFAGIPNEKIELFLDDAVYRYFDSTTEILSQGEFPEGIVLILKGNVSVSIIQTNGNLANLIRAGANDILGDLETLTGRPCLATAITEPGCAVAIWPAATVDRFLQCPYMARNIINLSYDRLAIINQVRTFEHKANVDQKIYAGLLRMAAADTEIKHSQSFLAEAVGCSRQTVNRVLGKLRDDNIVTLRKSVITITDKEALEALLLEPIT